MRCQKGKRICPGYRDASELDFRKGNRKKRALTSTSSTGFPGLNDTAAQTEMISDYGAPANAFAATKYSLLDLCATYTSPLETGPRADTSLSFLSRRDLLSSNLGYNSFNSLSMPYSLSVPVDQQGTLAKVQFPS